MTHSDSNAGRTSCAWYGAPGYVATTWFVAGSIWVTDLEWCPDTQTPPKPDPMPCGSKSSQDGWSSEGLGAGVAATEVVGDGKSADVAVSDEAGVPVHPAMLPAMITTPAATRLRAGLRLAVPARN